MFSSSHACVADTSHTLENAIVYESPHVTAVAPKNSPMYGGFFVTLLGRHFGHVDTSVRCAPSPPSPSTTTPFTHACNCSIKVGGSSCAQNMWFSDSSILCKVRAAAALLHALRDHVAAASWRRQQQDNRGRHSVLSSHPAAATGAPF